MRKEVLHRDPQHFVRILVMLTISATSAIFGSLSAEADTITGAGSLADSAWLEPRGINIADLVGLVPEDHLRGAIINYSTGEGVVQYLSGRRNGSTVTIEARLIPRFGPTFTSVPCLGKVAHYDEWPSPSPAATVHIFDGGVDITQKTVLLLLAPQAKSGPKPTHLLTSVTAVCQRHRSDSTRGVRLNCRLIWAAASSSTADTSTLPHVSPSPTNRRFRFPRSVANHFGFSPTSDRALPAYLDR